jgi:hypothetical protein
MFLEGLQFPFARVILLLMSNFSTRLDVPVGIEGAKLCSGNLVRKEDLLGSCNCSSCCRVVGIGYLVKGLIG